MLLALIAKFLPQVLPLGGVRMVVNDGLDRVRFPAPLPAHTRVRATARLLDAVEIDGGVQVKVRYTMLPERSATPVCIADHLTRLYLDPSHDLASPAMRTGRAERA
ncbi:MAG: hypothetical protein GEV07_00590 [Streptosporangiales bacterium]|nr:hypothetical protein [Streptosporangiales bacterium]